MAVEAPKTPRKLVPEVVKNAAGFGLLGVGLLFTLNILAALPLAVATYFTLGAVAGAGIGFFNWVANL